jgi:hypothetical protein
MALGDPLERIESKLDQIIRLLALRVAGEVKQGEAILLLGAAGLDRNLIAGLLKTTPNTVSVTLSTSKNKQSRRREAKSEPQRD